MYTAAGPTDLPTTCGGGGGRRQRAPPALSTTPSRAAALSAQVVLPGQAAEPAEMELTECGPRCACFSGCGQGFSSAAAAAAARVLSLRQLEGKGWGVLADAPLPAGMVVSHYAGATLSRRWAVWLSPASVAAAVPAWACPPATQPELKLPSLCLHAVLPSPMQAST